LKKRTVCEKKMEIIVKVGTTNNVCQTLESSLNSLQFCGFCL